MSKRGERLQQTKMGHTAHTIPIIVAADPVIPIMVTGFLKIITETNATTAALALPTTSAASFLRMIKKANMVVKKGVVAPIAWLNDVGMYCK